MTRAEFKASFRTMMCSAVIGTVIGAIPGLGSTLAGFLGYGAAKRASKTPEEFGKGALDGIAGAESANSATVGANLIPTLALGIPGNISAAILISALIIHGLTPGPLFEDALRQTLVLFRDTPMALLDRPIAILFMVLTAYSVWRLGFRPKPAILREP